jgi:hypothetical protein
MTGYWGIRTTRHPEHSKLITAGLEDGILRQGWGSQDLREVGRLVADGRADEDLRSIWRYTRAMLDIEMGDVVVTPHQPQANRHGVWRVTRAYEFDPLPDIWDGVPDFGNTLGVEPLGVIDHRSAVVEAPLRRALSSGFRQRMRNLNAYGAEIETLLTNPKAAERSSADEHFDRVRQQALQGLKEALRAQYRNADFEQPVRALLEVLYPGAVTHTAGPAEEGRDFVVEDVDRLGLPRRIIIQAKAWWDDVDSWHLDHGLDQLRRGIQKQGVNDVDLAVLMTVADSFPDDAEDRMSALEEEFSPARVRVGLLTADQTVALFLDHLPQISI